MRASLNAVVAVAVVIAAAGCSETSDSASAGTNTSKSFVVGAIAPTAASAAWASASKLRQVGDAFVADHPAYELYVTRDGRASLTAFEMRASSPGGADRGVRGRPMSIETRGISRRGGTAIQGAGRAYRGDDGRLHVGRGPVVEKLADGAAGVEQSWSFRQAPSGKGALEVRVAVSGLEYAGRTGSGLHFTDPATGVGFAYGVATWIDAAGRTTHVPARWERGEILLEVPESVLESSAYPAVLDPLLSPEFTLDQPASGLEAVKYYPPTIAFDGENYFIVWIERRSGIWDIAGARVTRDGRVLDPAGITISNNANDQRAPDVAFDGTNFLVVWSEQRSGTSWDIRAARVSRAGVVLDPNGVDVSAAAAAQQDPAVAFDGANYLVTWSDARNGGASWDIYGARVTPRGATVDAEGSAIATAAGHQTRPAVAAGAGSFLVTWADTRGSDSDIYGARVGADAAVLDAQGFVITNRAGEDSEPALAFDGTNFLVVWTGSGTLTDVFAARVSGAGALLDAAPVAVASGSSAEAHPAATFDGSNYLVTWSGVLPTGDVHAVRVTPAGALSGNAFAVAESGVNGYPSAASPRDGSAVIAYPSADETRGLVIRGRTVTLDGRLEISRAGNGAGTVTGPSIACGTTCAASYALDTVVEFSASPAVGSSFAGWSGACAGVEACRLTVGPVANVTARFVLDRYALDVTTSGRGSGTVAADGLAPALAGVSGTYDHGTDVALIASPAATSTFSGWTGACNGTALTCVVTMDKAKSVGAEFQLKNWEISTEVVGAGTITADPALTCSGASCRGTFDHGTVIALTAAAAPGSTFAGWSGACSGVNPTCSVTADAAKSATATFTVNRYALTAAIVGNGSIAGTPALTCGALECSATFFHGTSVTLTATAAPGSTFAGWSGACSGVGSCALTLSGPTTVSASFTVNQYQVTATAQGTGGGSIAADNAGLACSGGTCSGTFSHDTVLTLGATPDATSVFAGWSGACTGMGTCVLPVTEAKTVAATFTRVQHDVQAGVGGTGAGSITTSAPGLTCTNGVCSGSVDAGTVVTLTAVAGEGASFSRWEGACAVAGASAGASCTLTMDGPKTTTAVFDAVQSSNQYDLMVTSSGAAPGAGTVTSLPGAIVCRSSTCGDRFDAGTIVTLTATPDADAIFKGWAGACAGTSPTCTITISSAKNVTATFAPKFFPLTVNYQQVLGAAGGTVAGDGVSCAATGCTTPIANTTPAQTVRLTATPDANSIFAGWSGVCTGTDPSGCVVTMSTARTVFARFEPAWFALSATIGSGQGTISLPGSAVAAGTGLSCTNGSATGCTASVKNTSPDAVVTITATAAPGFVVKRWTGACIKDAPSGASSDTCTATIDRAKTVTAYFEPEQLQVAVAIGGLGGGSVSGAGLACTTGSIDGCSTAVLNTTPYTRITLTAFPNPGSIFAGWTGCTSASGTSCEVSVTGAKSVTAKFDPTHWALTVLTGGLGAGTVRGDAIACTTGSAEGCSALVPNTTPATTVTLVAEPAAGSFISGWSGCTSSSGATCTVAMNAAKSVTAVFQPTTWTLTARTSGTGGGTVTGAGIACTSGSTDGCSVGVPNTTPATVVTLTAAPDAISVFVGWTGCTSVNGATCIVGMTGARNVTATFQPATWVLTVKVAGLGSGTVTGAGISCTTGALEGCAVDVGNTSPATVVTLQAHETPGSVFAGWTNCSTSSGRTCTVTMTGARTVTANFAPSTYTLTVNTSGTGGGSVSGPGMQCASPTTGCTTQVANTTPATEVTLVATPDDVSKLASWTGCTRVSGNSCVVTMTGVRTVTASFAPAVYALNVVLTGIGAGTVFGDIAGVPTSLSCSTGSPDDCATLVANTSPATVVTLTATAGTGSTFTGWSGACAAAGPVPTCNVTMSTARTAYATFGQAAQTP